MKAAKFPHPRPHSEMVRVPFEARVINRYDVYSGRTNRALLLAAKKSGTAITDPDDIEQQPQETHVPNFAASSAKFLQQKPRRLVGNSTFRDTF